MPEPIKISEQGRALTCDEYDNNLDILRDRANHTGTQSCNTINDLDSCLTTSTTVGTLNTSISQNTTRIVNLENTLSASGSIANDLNSLEAALTADINENRASITTLETDVDNLEIRVSGVESNLVSLTNVVTLNNTTTTTDLNAVINVNNAQNTRLTTVENRATTLNANILTEAATRQSAVNNLQSEIDAEEVNRINEDTNLTTALDNERAARILGDDSLTFNINALSLDLNNKLTIEKNARIAEDVNLQTQLNTLSNSLSSAIPSATILPYAGNFNTIPSGFLLCAGAAISRTTYATLFSRIGIRYGAGNGSTTFNIPDFRDKIPYGSFNGTLDNTAVLAGATGNVRIIDTVNLPTHNHSVTINNHVHSVDINHDHHLYIHPHTHTTGSIGSHSHSLSPYRKVALGGGGEDEPGAEITEDLTDEVPIFPNTGMSSAAGPVVNAITVGIFPPPWTGSNRTDMLDAINITKSTNNAGAVTATTTNTGLSTPFDVRQESIRVNYIIKT